MEFRDSNLPDHPDVREAFALASTVIGAENDYDFSTAIRIGQIVAETGDPHAPDIVSAGLIYSITQALERELDGIKEKISLDKWLKGRIGQRAREMTDELLMADDIQDRDPKLMGWYFGSIRPGLRLFYLAYALRMTEVAADLISRKMTLGNEDTDSRKALVLLDTAASLRDTFRGACAKLEDRLTGNIARLNDFITYERARQQEFIYEQQPENIRQALREKTEYLARHHNILSS